MAKKVIAEGLTHAGWQDLFWSFANEDATDEQLMEAIDDLTNRLKNTPDMTFTESQQMVGVFVRIDQLLAVRVRVIDK